MLNRNRIKCSFNILKQMPLTSSAISSHRLCAYFIGILSLFASTIHQCTIENDVAFGSMSDTYSHTGASNGIVSRKRNSCSSMA